MRSTYGCCLSPILRHPPYKPALQEADSPPDRECRFPLSVMSTLVLVHCESMLVRSPPSLAAMAFFWLSPSRGPGHVARRLFRHRGNLAGSRRPAQPISRPENRQCGTPSLGHLPYAPRARGSMEAGSRWQRRFSSRYALYSRLLCLMFLLGRGLDMIAGGMIQRRLTLIMLRR